MSGPSLPGEAGAAGQALLATVDCRASRRADAPVTRHAVTVHADWSVETPHDLEVERVAVALGGYLSCVEFVDNVVPAVRRWVAVNTRRELPRMRRDRTGGWLSLEPLPGCCTGSPYNSAGALAEHQRSRRHCATVYAADLDQVTAFGKQVARACGRGWGQPLPVVRASALRRCVSQPEDVRELWQAGIGPEAILAVHRRLALAGERLPVSVYLGVLTEQPDVDWLVASAAAAPPDRVAREDLLEWLAWTQTSLDRRFRTDRSECLAMGIPRSTIWALSTNGYRPPDVHALERASGLSPVGAARLLEGWVAAGCTPAVSDLVRLLEAGVSAFTRVNRQSVDRLRAGASAHGYPAIGSTQAGLLLAVCGTVPTALVWLGAGHRDPFAVAGHLAADRSPYAATREGQRAVSG